MIDLLKIVRKKRTDPLIEQLVQDCGPMEVQAPLGEDVPETDYLFKKKGFSITFGADQTVEAIHIRLTSDDGYRVFNEVLPHGLKVPLNEPSVHTMLDKPTKTGGGGKSVLYGTTPKWDRYEFADHSIHIQYDESGKVNLITLS